MVNCSHRLKTTLKQHYQPCLRSTVLASLQEWDVDHHKKKGMQITTRHSMGPLTQHSADACTYVLGQSHSASIMVIIMWALTLHEQSATCCYQCHLHPDSETSSSCLVPWSCMQSAESRRLRRQAACMWTSQNTLSESLPPARRQALFALHVHGTWYSGSTTVECQLTSANKQTASQVSASHNRSYWAESGGRGARRG